MIWTPALDRLAAVLMAFALTAGCSDGCTNSVIDERASPSGTIKAVLFQRDCGATTGFTTQISLVEDGNELAGSGNAFVADDDHGKARAGGWGGPWAEMEWAAEDRLVIRYARESRIFEQNERVSGVRITYEPADH